MAAISWDIPLASFSILSLSDVKTVIEDLNTKLLELGLIDEAGANATKLTNFTTLPTLPSSSSYNFYTEYLSLEYKFPVGNGKYEYADVVGQDYKTISRASYDSTPLYLRFSFGCYKVCASTTVGDSTYIFTSNVYMSNNNLSWYLVNTSRFGYSAYINTSSTLTLPTTINSTRCYISLNEHSFFIHWFNKSVTSAHSTLNNAYSLMRHTIAFSITRDSGNIICISPKTFTSSLPTSSPSASGSYYGTDIIYLSSENIYGTNTVDTNTKLWFLPTTQGIVNGVTLIQPTVNYIASTYFSQNYDVWVTRVSDNSAPNIITKIIFDKNGTKIQRNFLNLNNMNLSWKPLLASSYASSTFIANTTSYAFTFDTYPLTTELI